MERVQQVALGSVLLTLLLGFFFSVSAERFTGGSYMIDASVVGNSFGGSSTGGSYQLTSSGGESIIGQGSGGSYKLDSGYVAQLQSSLELTVQPSGQVAYFPLDEPSGTAVYDRSSSSYMGNMVNTVTPGVTGKVGTAMSFDGGSASKISVASSSTLDNLTSITWSAWVKPTSASTDQIFLSKEGANYMRISPVFAPNTVFVSFNDNGTQKTLQSGATLVNNLWYHIVVTFTAGSMKLYMNGFEQDSRADIAGPLDFNTGNLEMGQWTDGSPFSFTGTLDEVKIFDRVLSASEVKAEYQAGAAGNESGLSFASAIVPGVSSTSDFDAVVMTDAQNGYNLSVNQNQDLTKGGDTISAVSGSIGTPVSWVEGTTKGLGFTLYGTNATSIPGKWNSGDAYAAFPGSATSYYLRTGRSTSKDVLNMRLRLDVPLTQVSGAYTNVITTTGTITP